MVEIPTDPVEPVVSRLLDTLGGLLYLLLAVYVVHVAPREAKNRAFGLFAAGFGSYFVLSNVAPLMGHPLGAALPWVMSPLLVTGGVGAVWLAHALVARMADEPRRPFLGGMLVALGLLAVHLGLLVVFSGEIVAFRAADFPAWERAGVFVQWVAFSGGVLAPLFGVLYALVFAYGPDVDPRRRTEARLVTVAFATYLGFIAGATRATDLGVSSGMRWSAWATLVGIAAMVGLAALWLDRTRRVPESASARNIALYMLVTPLAGLLVQGLEAPVGAYGLTRTVGVLVLAYGIVKHDILGIEDRVRWGVSRTTVAGVFVAVFFVAGELAETFFGGVLGPYLGVVAAGGLVFFLSPLQRLADRVAETAVPTGPPAGAGSNPEHRRALYRSTVERFLADSSLTPDEEQELADLADELGLGAGEATRIQREVREEG